MKYKMLFTFLMAVILIGCQVTIKETIIVPKSSDAFLSKIEILHKDKPLDIDFSSTKYEYTYTLFGTKYHVYQIYVVDGRLSREVFVFTFTSPESIYSSEIDEVKTIFDKIGF